MTLAISSFCNNPVPQFHHNSQAVSAKVSQALLQALQTGKFFKQEKQLIKDITAITPDQLKRVLETFVQELGQKAHKHDPIKVLNQLSQLIPLEHIQNAVRTKYPTHKDALTTAKQMFQQAKYYLEVTENKSSFALRAKLTAIFDTMISIIESILNAFGIAQFFTPAENDLHADMKSQKIMTLVTLFTLLTSILLPIIGPALAGIIIGGALLFIGVLSLIFPLVRPAPSKLPEAKNLTQQVLQGQIPCVAGREPIIHKIAQTLISSKRPKTHPLLLGKSGVGKTQTVEAFVHAVESGKFPELQGKKVFYINTADLVNSQEMFGGGNRSLTKICEAMGKHRENIVLVLDEIHLACQKRENNVIGDQLKSLLDDKPDNFPYVIGLTTEEEYYRDIYLDHSAFARRFKPIKIENTGEDETFRILSNFVLQQAPNAMMAPGALNSLWKKTRDEFTKKAPQPLTALKILSQCIKRTTEHQKSDCEKKLNKARNKVQSLYARGAIAQGLSSLPYDGVHIQQIQKLESEVATLEAELQRDKARQQQIFQAKDMFAKIKAETYRSVLKVSKCQQARLSSKDKAEMNKFLLLSHFMEPTLYDQVVGNKLGVKTVIDDALIDDVIREEKDNEQKAKNAIQQGKAQLQQRAGGGSVKTPANSPVVIASTP